MKILLATHNPAKIRDYKKILAAKGFNIETLNSLNIQDKFEENKETFKANAKDKALFYYNLAKMPTIAEDSGLEIDYFNGEPGVKSRRWPGYVASDEELIEYLRIKISSIPAGKSSARFTAVSCLVKSKKDIYFAKNSLEGYLTKEYNKNYNEGYPYRAFFKDITFNRYLTELSAEEYQSINQRQKNIEELIKFL